MIGSGVEEKSVRKEGADRAIYPSLHGRRVVVTGGGAGIGAGLVEAFVRQGARVVFVDVADEPSRALVDRLTVDAAYAPVFHRLDLIDLDAIAACFAAIEAEWGGIDALINNAGNDDRHRTEAVTPAYWENRMAVNLRHLFFCAQAVVPGMKAHGHGAIVNVGSISWHLGLDELVLYQTAKAGIEGMTRALARELGPAGIRVTTVVPGNVQTPSQQRWYGPDGESKIVDAQCLKARIQPADIAAMVLFLTSDDARLCTGHAYWVDAGWG